MFPSQLRRSRVLFVSILLVGALGLVACSPRAAGEALGDGARATRPTPSPDPTVSIALPDGDRDGVPDSEDLCPTLAETGQWTTVDDGCPDTIDDLVQFASTEIDAFWQRQFDAINEDYNSPNRVRAYDGLERTACGETVPDNAFYCQADHSIYFDQSLFDEALANIGDFAPVFILAHEWGHLVQGELGILTIPSRSGIRNELQADCFAGVFTQDAEARGLLEPGDTDEALALAFEAGDPGGSRQTDISHGTSRQRQEAFALGYTKSISECLAL